MCVHILYRERVSECYLKIVTIMKPSIGVFFLFLSFLGKDGAINP